MTIFRVRCIALFCATVFSVSIMILLDFSWPALLILGLVSFSVLLTLLAIEKNARQIRLLIRNQRDLLAMAKENPLGTKGLETEIQVFSQKSRSLHAELTQKLNHESVSRDKIAIEVQNSLGTITANIIEINLQENQIISSLKYLTSELHNNEIRTRQIASLVKSLQPKGPENQIIQQRLDDLAKNKDLKDLTELVQNIKTEQRANQLRLRQIGQLTRSVELLLTEEEKVSAGEDINKMVEDSRREITFRVLDDLSQIRYILESGSNDSAANNDQH